MKVEDCISFPLCRLQTVSKKTLDLGTKVDLHPSVFDSIQKAIMEEENKRPLVYPKSNTPRNYITSEEEDEISSILLSREHSEEF